ncbi:VCBS repeat-containing protein [Aurantibacter sp.]|uniref:FG-GAP repeat domain-containing protein n=1 Tax=Aurantibacter sp. TaxID=2807103 RepID=UPI0032675D3A
MLGIIDTNNDPYINLSNSEQQAIKQTGLFPNSPRMNMEDWTLLRNYIIAMAPDSLVSSNENKKPQELVQFIHKAINLDSTPGTYITHLKYNKQKNSITSADMSGNIMQYNFEKNNTTTNKKIRPAITDITETNTLKYITIVGELYPSEIANGRIEIISKDSLEQIPFPLQRPVNTVVDDLNRNGKKELVVSEFGNLTGKLSLLKKTKRHGYEKKTLLNMSGCIRTIVQDMNGDGKQDLVTLTSQGREGVTILYQKENLEFVAENVLKFSPVYGSSWFELVDYDNDGDFDIVTVNGDNADKSFVQKPYHGLRIYINNGNNNFEEKYFFAVNGATRVVSNDFDLDGDIDFGIVSTFPDYEKKPGYSFVYLENKTSENFQFNPFTFKNSKLGNWFLMDIGDVDKDGDQDIILSSFSHPFAKAPKHLTEAWKTSNIDLMLLENKTIHHLDE